MFGVSSLMPRRTSNNRTSRQGPAETEAPQELQTSRAPGEGEGATHAQVIVKELYQRYQKQVQRWKDYRSLFFFLAFVALFLAVLYSQRQANTAFRVHATLADVLLPRDTAMASTGDVYAWLTGVLAAVWVDPKCGDGLCEAPFEFPSYSTFGCRADCGQLESALKLTRLQVDVYFDFSHPVGSMPSSELMQQTSWNLCPTQTVYNASCYYSSDITFNRLSGSQTQTIFDAPDGEWDLTLRRDIFMKTRGAVRDFNQTQAVSLYYRVYLAALSALAEQNTEVLLLSQAVSIGRTSLLDYIKSMLVASNATTAGFFYQQLINATCGCYNTPLNASTSVTWGSSGMLLKAFNNSAGGITSWPDYQTAVCAANNAASPLFYEMVQQNVTSTGTPLAPGSIVPTGVNVTLVNNTVMTTNVTSFCATVLGNLQNWRANMTSTMQQLMIDRRLGDGRTTGKVATRNTIFNNLRNNIISQWPELFDPIFTVPLGTVATLPISASNTNNVTVLPSARVDILQTQFVAGVFYATQPQPAFLNITRRSIYTPDITMPDMATRAAARREEVRAQQLETLGIHILHDPTYNYSYPDITVEDLLLAFGNALNTPDPYYSQPLCNTTSQQAAGCMPVLLSDNQTTVFLSNFSLPWANNSALNLTKWGAGVGLQTAYNLTWWQGNTTAYLSCNLDSRAPEYQGTCVAMPVSCNATGNESTPYNCTNYVTGALTGNVSDTLYRSQCEYHCDRQTDCNAICECYGNCGSNQFCECQACSSMSYASNDQQFQDILSGLPGSTSNPLAAISAPAFGRRLQQASPPDPVLSQLQAVTAQVSSVNSQQATIQSQMIALQAQVDQANQLARQRANDNRLIDLIQASRQDINAGNTAVNAKLDEIIGKQNQSLALAESASQALSAIAGLAQKQLAAQQALESAVQNQLSAIKVATYQGIISVTQALSLWKRARRDRALTFKTAKLANIPCNSLPKADYLFQLENGNIVDNTTARERYIGLTNRVISGLLLHQYRTNDTNCTDSKFSKIQQICTGPTTIRSFGVDPVFKRGTSLYTPDFDDINGTMVTNWYNCSLLNSATYNMPFLNKTVNAAPYCAELYNSQNLPYAFHYFPLPDREPGFPAFFDINLAAADALTWERYLEEGLFLDQNTRQLTAQLVTYNAPLRIFGYFQAEFYFSDGGSIKITYQLHTVRVELYNSSEDTTRYAFEVILSMWIFGMMAFTLYQIAMTQKEQKNFLIYFSHGWNWIVFGSNALLTSCMVIWWIFVVRYARKFDTSLRHDVYNSLQPQANFLALAAGGANLEAVNEDVLRLKALIDMLNWYFALNGINILLLIARVLKLMDFQPRLGVVTRSLWLAGPDLIHFAIVAGMVFVGYAMMAHLIFGNAIEKFQTFGDSVNTCFECLLGNIDVNADLRALGGLQSVAGALFFWSFELLVYMVLLNFLLAIIVDAFSEVKEKTHETVGIHTELWQLGRDKWRSMMGLCSTNYISDDKLGNLLKQWAGDGDDAERKEAQADVQKLLTILNEDLDEEDLRNVLMECLKDAPGQEDAAAKPPPPRTGLARFLPQRRKVVATPHEVAQAAKYIVDRFGEPEKVEEELISVYPGSHDGEHGDGDAPAFSKTPAIMDRDNEQLHAALKKLDEVQRELADGQRNLLSGQRQLAEQQAKLVGLMNTENS
ncbi:hypothetical protein V8C86DRAFT_2852326 [Haematococcus lacustris]